MKIKKCLLFLVGLLIFDTLLGSILNSRPPKLFSKSVTTVGYNNERQGVTKTTLPLNQKIILEEKYLKLPKDTNESMPLFINSDDLPKEIKQKQISVKGQYLVLGTKTGVLILYDLSSSQEYWSIQLPSPIAKGSIVINLKKGKIYFRSITHIHSINIDGSQLQSIPFNYKEMIAKELNLPTDHLNFTCQSAAAGFNNRSSKPYFFFSCAVPNQFDIHPNLVGQIVAIYIDQEGQFQTPLHYKVYKSCIRTNKPNSGLSCGIWNSGMAPTITEDNKILISTGNGSLMPSEKNYGCSVVKIDGDKFDVQDKNDYYSLDYFNFHECLLTDLDFGSSAVSYLHHNGQKYASLIGKDGILRLFDPDDLPQNDPRKMHHARIGNYTFGQPLIIPKDQKSIQIIYQGRPEYREYKLYDYFLATKNAKQKIHQLKLVESEIQNIGCVGFVHKKGIPEDQMSLFFSGSVRKDFILTTKKSQLKRDLIHFFKDNDKIRKSTNRIYQSGYFPVQNIQIGYSVPNKTFPRYQIQPLHFNLSHLLQIPRLKTRPPHITYKTEEKLLYHQPNIGQILALKKNISTTKKFDYCGDPPSSDYQKLFLYKIDSISLSSLTEWVIGIYQSDKSLKLTPLWQKRIKNNTRHQISNIAAVLSPNDGAIVTTPIVNNRPNQSILKLFSIKNGTEMASCQFEGTVHFSMPLIVGDKIFIATKNNGIKMFKIKPKKHFLKKISFIGNHLL